MPAGRDAGGAALATAAAGSPAFSRVIADDLAANGVNAPLVLPNPIDGPALRRRLLDRAAARTALGVGGDGFVVGVVGRLHPKKDPARALRAFSRFRESQGDGTLVFVGDGGLRPELEQAAGPGVVFAGFRDDATTLLRAFDVLLACSTAEEAFGLALLEALAAGVRVIAADRPGPRFVLGDCATYFETDDGLAEALQRAGAGLLRHDAEAGIERADREFSIAALARRYAAVWQWDRGRRSGQTLDI